MAMGIVMSKGEPGQLGRPADRVGECGRTGLLVTNDSPKSSVKTPTIEST